jgi:hypothetical protein
LRRDSSRAIWRGVHVVVDGAGFFAVDRTFFAVDRTFFAVFFAVFFVAAFFFVAVVDALFFDAVVDALFFDAVVDALFFDAVVFDATFFVCFDALFVFFFVVVARGRRVVRVAMTAP